MTAYYTLGLLKNKKKYFEVFKIGLGDESAQVVHTVLQALYGIKKEELLPYYEQILDRYKTDENSILCNVMHRLKELNSKAEKVIRKAAEHSHQETAKTAKKILQELN